MMEISNTILSLSLSGSIIAILIFALKFFLKHKLPKSIQYYIWIVVLLRFIIPFSFEGSIMNGMFYNDKIPMKITSQDVGKTINNTSTNIINSSTLNNIQQDKVINEDVDYGKYLINLFNQYAVYIWLIGAIIIFNVNLNGYFKFLKYLRNSNKPSTDKQNKILKTLINSRCNVKLARNPFVTTPMLIGIIKPYIIIPDIDFDEKQLKNIFLHELSHLKRFDIVVKWLTLIATTIHWFNPLMYFIKKEINHACELACDEAVIKNLNIEEKQDYGDTLISIVAEHKYPVKALQATMCEEKKSLKERLIAIMNHSKKSKFITIISVLLMILAIIGAILLGASVITNSKNSGDEPPNIYVSTEGTKAKVAIIGGYSWKNGNKGIFADSSHPSNFKYKSDNIINITAKQQIVISTQKLKLDKKYNFTIEEVSVYKDGKIILFKPEASFIKGDLYLQAPLDAGEYVYCLILNFKNKGTVNYGFVVRNNMIIYNLTEISKYKTPYIGNNSKVGAIIRNIPEFFKDFKQQYFSLVTSNKPYELNVFYEINSDTPHNNEWLTLNIDNNEMYSNLCNNALVLFCMIDNLDIVNFAFRDTESNGKLDESKYDKLFTFSRTSIEEIYGDIKLLAKDMSLLQDALNGKTLIKKDEVSITTDTNNYSSMMSSIRGINMTPNFKSNKKYTELEYHWVTEKGWFIQFDHSKKEVRNQGEALLWSDVGSDVGLLGNDINYDIEDSFNIQLEVIDTKNRAIVAKTKLTIYNNKGFYEIR